MSIYTKMLEVQKKVEAIVKDEANPHFKSKYFDINGLLKELKPALNEVGLLVLQPVTQTESGLVLKTIVVDPSDPVETMEFSMMLRQTQNPQELGSQITYFRRYSLQSLFSLEGEDDDGNTATAASKAEPTYAPLPSKTEPETFDKSCEMCGVKFRTKYQNAKTCWTCHQVTKASEASAANPINPADIPF